MSVTLLIKALIRMILGFAVMAALLFLSMPLVLGSLAAFLIMFFYIPVIVMRIKNEEKVLEKGLPGYIEYEKKVRHRLIPFIW